MKYERAKARMHVVERVNAISNSSKFPINKHLKFLYKKNQGYVMSLSSYYITNQHNHKIITDFHDLQLFLCSVNQQLTRVLYRATSVQGPSALCSLRRDSDDREAFGYHGPTKLCQRLGLGLAFGFE
jgi:hypothetical protein